MTNSDNIIESNSNEIALEENDDIDEDESFRPSITPPVIPPWQSHRRTLSESQQQKLRDYLDDELMRINRKYIQRLNDPSRGYQSFKELIYDLNKLIDVIWYSITTTITDQSTNYNGIFQSDYLLRIADDFVDYIEGYESEPCPVEMLQLIQKLDGMFSQLLVPDSPSTLTRTEAVRLTSIAERTRILVATALDKGFQVEVSETYSGVLDKTA